MKIIIHRGSNQIGGSCVEIATDKARIVIDVGFELNSSTNNNSGTKPKINGLFKPCRNTVDALFISHYHADHVGYVHDVNEDVKIFMGEKAVNIFNTSNTFKATDSGFQPFGYLTSEKEFLIKDITVVPILVDHSAFDSYAFLIYANGKSIIYSGDFRMHGNKKFYMQNMIKKLPKNIDALLIEGTSLGREISKHKSEETIGKEAQEFMSEITGPIFVLQSSTNIDRIVQMYKAARKTKRLFIVDIYTAHIMTVAGGKMPNPISHKDIKVFYPVLISDRIANQPEGKSLLYKFSNFRIAAKDISSRSDYCMLIRDSMYIDLKRRIKNINEAGLVYSMWEGYRKQQSLKRLVDFFNANNAQVRSIHTSGHADLPAIKKIVEACRPRMIIPMHSDKPEKLKEEFGNVICLIDGKEFQI